MWRGWQGEGSEEGGQRRGSATAQQGDDVGLRLGTRGREEVRMAH